MSVRPCLLGLAAALVAAFAPAASAQWSSDSARNQAVAARSGAQVLPKAAATSDGGTWIAWFDQNSGNFDVYAQRYDSKGNRLGPAGGILVSGNPQSSSLVDWDLIADSSDNAVLVFTDTRAGGDLDVYAYRISTAGIFLWGPDGVAVSSSAVFEADPMVTEASDGDFVIVWDFLPAGDGAVLMQRLSPAGVPRFGVPVVAAAALGETPGFARVVPSLSGDVIVAWVRDIGFFSSVKYIRAQRFDATGAGVWAGPVQVFDAYNVPIAHAPQLLPDGAGGAVLAWHGSNPATSLFEAFAQRLSAAGAERFAHNGAALATTPGMNHLNPDVAFQPGSGEIFAFWNEANAAQSQSGLFAQKLNASGLRQWGSGGVPLMPVDGSTKFPPVAVPAGSAAMAVLTWEPGGAFGQDQILAIRVNGLGGFAWPGASRSICSLSSGKSVRLGVARDAAGEIVVAWEDDRNGDDDVYGQNLHADGTLGESLLDSAPASVSLAAGGVITLSLEAGAAHGGRSYWMLGSASGTSPGVTKHGATVPLNDDKYFRLTLRNPNHPLLTGFRGSLDPNGNGTAFLTVPAGFNPNLAGATVHHAFAVLDGSNQVVLVSEAEPVLLQP